MHVCLCMHVSEFIQMRPSVSRCVIHTACEYRWQIYAKRLRLSSLQVAVRHSLYCKCGKISTACVTCVAHAYRCLPWIHIHSCRLISLCPPCLALSLICLSSPPLHLSLPPCLWGQWPRQAPAMLYWCGRLVSSSSTYSPSCLISVEGKEYELCVYVCACVP